MEKKTEKNTVIDQMYLGHRIHLNWPLLLILAWFTLVAYASIMKEEVCTNGFGPFFQYNDEE